MSKKQLNHHHYDHPAKRWHGLKSVDVSKNLYIASSRTTVNTDVTRSQIMHQILDISNKRSWVMKAMHMGISQALQQSQGAENDFLTNLQQEDLNQVQLDLALHADILLQQWQSLR
ncbi:hypothetical protein LX64_00173 [Chitinophaga skermanii]|uniref:Uncharacterized protein n=1 Tax=Chitinophaga skermanii TaxID=331697 RepID=A0A327R132_9BACT|nr:hypothetical protein [Chitinophaga skermanii]RAJ10569.1 hypothetical protein LX64_00173 [Chitinophaga skermanii]